MSRSISGLALRQELERRLAEGHMLDQNMGLESQD